MYGVGFAKSRRGGSAPRRLQHGFFEPGTRRELAGPPRPSPWHALTLSPELIVSGIALNRPGLIVVGGERLELPTSTV